MTPSTATSADAPAQGRGGGSPRRLSAQVSLLYAAVYLHYGVFGVFVPVWLTHRGLTPDRVGLLISAPMLLRIAFVAPVTGLADRLRRIRELLFLCLAGAAALMAGLSLVQGFTALAIFFVVFSVAWDPIPILADAYAVAGIRARGLDFGRMRVWGSLAFILANLAGGKIIDMAGIQVVPGLTALLLLAPLLVIPFLPPDRRFGDPTPSAKGEWKLLLKDAPLMLVILATSLIGASTGLFAVSSAIHWTAKGYSAAFIGLLSGVGIASEICVLWVAQWLLGARSPLWLIAIGTALIILRWLIMAFDPPAAVLVPLQLLQGCGIAILAGLMLFIARRVPVHLVATAQGVNAVIVGVIAAGATAGSGYLWAAYGSLGYLLMALVAGVGLALIGLMLVRPIPAAPGWGGKSEATIS
jgi:PPP family 3-phenylpropionic acid transporter